MSIVRRYGWVRDVFDPRDYRHPEVASLAALPAVVDIRRICPPVYNQGQLGSCTGNAIAGTVETLYLKEKRPDFTPSRLFIYYYERMAEGTIPEDAGAQIRDGIKVCASIGAPHETLWPYDLSRLAVQPDAAATDDARLHRIAQYSRLDNTNLDQLRGVLAAGVPFVFGFEVFPAFESPQVAATGVVPMPGPFEGPVGGHAVMAVGYDDRFGRFLARNSWGPQWGQAGYFTIPYRYVTNPVLASDFWVIRLAN